ncbi:hypothetical protein F1D05_01355 [Kribbella qitaiheensis]|uniref:Uncharacterized protein n=1 Tax=Kribbella qitaiheensis TaxID=1544730 RepID=A0A7G6WS25_9ACTN|nr:hypothetical protein [Kribbella qitaiheensis]QNE16790.1 hypothetical protein F1D05_01355 [Kribbella qitaiheensis]
MASCGYPEDIAHAIAAKNGWQVRRDGADWRRVVPSPLPQRVVELDVAELLLQNEATVVLADFGTPSARALGAISVGELEALSFPSGGPIRPRSSFSSCRRNIPTTRRGSR